MQRASTLGPENFGEFLTQFPHVLRDEIPALSLGYRVAYCATHRDRADVAGSVGRRVVEGEARWVAGTLGAQTPYCPPLASRLEDGPARVTYATRRPTEPATAGRGPGVATLASILELGLTDLGPDEMFAVFCERGAWDRVRYCVGPSCSPVLNGVSFCSALDARLSR